MSFKVTHDLHSRRFGRNLFVGLALVGFIAFAFGMTIYKTVNGDFQASAAPAATTEVSE